MICSTGVMYIVEVCFGKVDLRQWQCLCWLNCHEAIMDTGVELLTDQCAKENFMNCVDSRVCDHKRIHHGKIWKQPSVL